MPYIKKEDYDSAFDCPTNAGELNYCLTMICKDYFKRMGGKYQQINDIVGTLEGCKLEFYRRVVSNYEDEKMKSNGDVY